ncbi:DNA/RNA non-specific endonuclease [Sphingobacterium paucimobilis]|uniref:DNA/RNA non-specific endonuclease n=1 Tax=Sphingobacterium paucimobilis TaxID=1385985 RepID=UPI001F2671A5|nr:DNA/RNA non-specific endonuclease [Sphingobacterium paucimobilis]
MQKLNLKTKNSFTLFFCFALLVVSCRKDNDFSVKDIQNKVSFTSAIEGLPMTRTSGTKWDMGDAVGIFMYSHGSTLTTDAVVDNGFNKKYTTTGNGNFSPVSATEQLTYPSGSKVSFVAYYPYQSTASLTPAISITDQSNQTALDFMYAQQTTGWTGAQGPVALSFSRQMTKIEIKLKGSALTDVKAVFKNSASTGTFDLATGQLLVDATSLQDINAKISVNGTGETLVEWTLFPGAVKDPGQVVFTKSDGKSYIWKLPAGTTFAKGHRYQYDITLGKDDDVTPIPTGSYMELPLVQETATLKYSLKMSTATKRNYSMLYDTKNKLALWVAYPLSSDYLGGQDRTDDWGYDPDYNSTLQALLSKGYPNNQSLLIDRGHQLPSGDRTKTYQENASTFYYTNMTPQNRPLNQGVWAELENKIRTWTGQSGVDTMYVVTGAMVTTAADQNIDYVKDNANTNVAKPKYYYKALAMKKGNTYYTIGFRMNNANPSSKDYMTYKVKVEELEKETGFTFFPALSKESKGKIDETVWRK